MGKLAIYRLLLLFTVCLSVCLSTTSKPQRPSQRPRNRLSRHAPAARCYTSFPLASNTSAATAIGMWGYAPVPIPGTLVKMSLDWHVFKRVCFCCRIGIEILLCVSPKLVMDAQKGHVAELLQLCVRMQTSSQVSLRDRATRASQLKSFKLLHKCTRFAFEKP